MHIEHRPSSHSGQVERRRRYRDDGRGTRLKYSYFSRYVATHHIESDAARVHGVVLLVTQRHRSAAAAAGWVGGDPRWQIGNGPCRTVAADVHGGYPGRCIDRKGIRTDVQCGGRGDVDGVVFHIPKSVAEVAGTRDVAGAHHDAHAGGPERCGERYGYGHAEGGLVGAGGGHQRFIGIEKIVVFVQVYPDAPIDAVGAVVGAWRDVQRETLSLLYIGSQVGVISVSKIVSGNIVHCAVLHHVDPLCSRRAERIAVRVAGTKGVQGVGRRPRTQAAGTGVAHLAFIQGIGQHVEPVGFVEGAPVSGKPGIGSRQARTGLVAQGRRHAVPFQGKHRIMHIRSGKVGRRRASRAGAILGNGKRRGHVAAGDGQHRRTRIGGQVFLILECNGGVVAAIAGGNGQPAGSPTDRPGAAIAAQQKSRKPGSRANGRGGRGQRKSQSRLGCSGIRRRGRGPVILRYQLGKNGGLTD